MWMGRVRMGEARSGTVLQPRSRTATRGRVRSGLIGPVRFGMAAGARQGEDGVTGGDWLGKAG